MLALGRMAWPMRFWWALALFSAGWICGVDAAHGSEEAILLAFKASVANWDAVYTSRGMQGWCTAGPGCKESPICAWTGVTCDPFASTGGDRVTSLDLTCDVKCTVRAEGQLIPQLGGLEYLDTLDLEGNAFYGTLPPEWGFDDAFPRLTKMLVSSNLLTGPLPPDEWSTNAGFPSLVEFHAVGNKFSGPLPETWCNSTTAWFSLLVWNVGHNMLSGTLPRAINGIITMSMVGLQGNRFNGTLPPEWGRPGYLYLSDSSQTFNTTQELSQFYLHENLFTGTLPPEWGAPNSFTALKTLTLGGNPLATTLPASWGTQGGFPKLEMLNLSTAQISGSLPDAWAQGLPSLQTLSLDGNALSSTVPASWSQMQSLKRVYIQPGNPQLCTEAPANAKFQLCVVGDSVCKQALQPTNNATACGGAPPPDSGGSGVPVAAIAAPIAALAAVAAALGGYLLYRRQGRRGPQAQREGKPAPGPPQQPLDASGDESGLDSGVVYPPPELTFHEEGELPPAIGVAALDKSHSSCSASGESGSKVAAAPSKGSSCFPCLPGALAVEDEFALPPSAGTGRQSHQQHHSGSTASTAGLASGGTPILGQGSRPRSMREPVTGGGNDGQEEDSLEGPNAPTVAPYNKPSSRYFTAAELEAFASDWIIKPEEIEIATRPNGAPWRLGHGGFGKVFKALRNGVQPVAVKILSDRDGLMRMSEAEFQHEIAILRACRDSNIVQFQGVCHSPEGLMLVTEYLEGGNLYNNIGLRRVSWYHRGKRIAEEVARGLAFLHSRRIVHFDIKSANILLTREGNAKIGDVGMARILQADYITGVVGTLAWSAPEMLWGHKCTTSADIYSFGVVLWEIATGEQPVRGQLRDVRVPEECPEAVREVILACMDPKPSARPRAVQLVEMLRKAPGARVEKVSSAPSPIRTEAPSQLPLAGASSLASPPEEQPVSPPLQPAEEEEQRQQQQQDHHHQQQQQQQGSAETSGRSGGSSAPPAASGATAPPSSAKLPVSSALQQFFEGRRRAIVSPFTVMRQESSAQATEDPFPRSPSTVHR